MIVLMVPVTLGLKKAPNYPQKPFHIGAKKTTRCYPEISFGLRVFYFFIGADQALRPSTLTIF